MCEKKENYKVENPKVELNYNLIWYNIDYLLKLELKDINTFEELSTYLWLEETIEMKEIKNEIINLMSNNKDYKEKYIEYDNIARNIILEKWKLDRQESMKLDIALILLTWLIYFEWWKKDYYKENITEALIYSNLLKNKKIKLKIKELKDNISKKENYGK